LLELMLLKRLWLATLAEQCSAVFKLKSALHLNGEWAQGVAAIKSGIGFAVLGVPRSMLGGIHQVAKRADPIKEPALVLLR